jgi:hypothetical protein
MEIRLLPLLPVKRDILIGVANQLFKLTELMLTVLFGCPMPRFTKEVTYAARVIWGIFSIMPIFYPYLDVRFYLRVS